MIQSVVKRLGRRERLKVVKVVKVWNVITPDGMGSIYRSILFLKESIQARGR
jgi:hypothetical protein